MAARHGLGIAEIDLGAGGAGGTEGEAAELQPRRGRLGALADQVQREFAILRLFGIVKDLEPIDDGADRADEIVTYPLAEQRGEFEHVRSGSWCGRTGHKMFLEIRC